MFVLRFNSVLVGWCRVIALFIWNSRFLPLISGVQRLSGRMPDSQPGFECPLLLFWSSGIFLLSQLCKRVPGYRRHWKCKWIFFVQYAAWLNASHRSRVGVGMKSSAMEWSVNLFEWSNGLNTALYKNHTCALSTCHSLSVHMFLFIKLRHEKLKKCQNSRISPVHIV